MYDQSKPLRTSPSLAHPPSTSITERAATGAERSQLYPTTCNQFYPTFPTRIDLVFTNPVAMERLGQTYGEGASKYPPHNWKKGFPESVLLAHVYEHLRKYQDGDFSEDHLAHAAWNLHTLMYVQEKQIELLDLTKDMLINHCNKPSKAMTESNQVKPAHVGPL